METTGWINTLRHPKSEYGKTMGGKSEKMSDDEMRAYKLKKQLESEDVEDEDEEGDDGDEEDSEDEEDDEVGEQQDEGVADARGVERKGGKSSRRHDTKDGTGQVIPAENVGKAIPHLRPECEDLPRAKRSRFG